MIFSRWTFLGKSKRILEEIMPKAKQIESLGESYRSLSNHELKEIMSKNRKLIQSGSLSLDDAMIEVYACAIEASSRILNKRHFFQQILGGIVVHEGKIAELKTGEGKTLVSTLPIILNALSGYGVHCVTVNDYLAERDCKLNRPLYEFFDLTNGYITNETSSEDKENLYDMDITYGTASRAAFDFLESHMASSYEEKYRFSCKFICVDECDYLLIDEAKVPLIISSQSNEDNDIYLKFNPIVSSLQINNDFTVNLKGKTAWLTPSGFDKIETFSRENGFIIGGLFASSNIDYFHIISNLLRAHFVMIQNKDYVVHDGQIVIIDESTGRLAVGKKYSHGIHQAIEAKEGVKISKSTTISASITYPNFFRMYEKIGGMTGTGMTEANEFKEVYNLDVVQVPTHRPVQRIDEPFARLYRTKNDMFDDIAKLVYETNKTGQPILIGTESVLASEILSSILSKHHIRHSVLNAKNHKEEASIIAQAGKKYAVTISTNMAGRGVDIMLGGNPEEAANDLAEREHENKEYVLRVLCEKVARERQEVMNLGGLLVIVAGTLNNKKDEQQLAGRSGRQGNPGKSIRFSSLEDSIMSEDNKILQQFITLSCQLDEDSSLADDSGRYICNQNSNQIIDTIQQGKQDSSYESRKHLLKFDNTIHKQRKVIYELRDYILLTSKLIELVISFSRSLVDKLYSDYGKISYGKFVDQVNIVFQENFSQTYKINDIKNKISDKVYNVLIHKDEYEIRSHIIRTFDRCFKSVINKYEDLKRTIFIANYNQDDPYIKYTEIAYRMFMEAIQEIEMGVIKMITSSRPQSNDSLFDFNFDNIFSRNRFDGKSQFANLFNKLRDDSDDEDDFLKKFEQMNSEMSFDDIEDIEEDIVQDDNILENIGKTNENAQEKNEVDDLFAALARKNSGSSSVDSTSYSVSKSNNFENKSMNLNDDAFESKSVNLNDEAFERANKSLENLIHSLLNNDFDDSLESVLESKKLDDSGVKVKKTKAVKSENDSDVKVKRTKAVKSENNSDVKIKKTKAVKSENDSDVKVKRTKAVKLENDSDVKSSKKDKVNKLESDVKKVRRKVAKVEVFEDLNLSPAKPVKRKVSTKKADEGVQSGEKNSLKKPRKVISGISKDKPVKKNTEAKVKVDKKPKKAS